MAVEARSVQPHSEECARFYAGAPPVGNERLSLVGAVLINSRPIELTVALCGLQRFDPKSRFRRDTYSGDATTKTISDSPRVALDL